MTSAQPHTVAPWDPKCPPEIVRRYIRAFEGEFDTEYLSCGMPYGGPVSARFRRSKTSASDRSGFHRFTNQHPTVIWEPRSHRIINPLTADLLAAAQALGGMVSLRGSAAGPFGIHAAGRDIWVGLLDGGVGVEVTVWERQTTNRVGAAQRTTILGVSALRLLTRSLGFEHLPRRLHGEHARPELDGIDRELIERFAR